MTRNDRKVKRKLIEILNKQQYYKYAELLDLFDVHVTNDPNSIAYMYPDRGIIVINRTCDVEQVSPIIRHEIMHEFLDHTRRLLKKLGASVYDIYKLTPQELEDIGYDPDAANIAMDYDISNQMYTEEDKEILRKVSYAGKIVSCLITEDQHPDWVDLSMEELYDEVMKLTAEEKAELQRQNGLKHKNQRPETIDPGPDKGDKRPPKDEPKDSYDEIWVYGSFDKENGVFLDDDNEIVDYQNTFVPNDYLPM